MKFQRLEMYETHVSQVHGQKINAFVDTVGSFVFVEPLLVPPPQPLKISEEYFQKV